MKKLMIFVLVLAGCIVLDLSCVALFERPLFAMKDDSDNVNQRYAGLFYDVVDCFESETYVLKKGSKFACPLNVEIVKSPMVQIDGILYLQTGRINELGKCGVFDGEISSSTSKNEMPDKDNQSNFGSGYGYQIGKEGIVEVFMDGQWHVFASEDIFDELVLDLNSYLLQEDLKKRNDADTRILFRIDGRVYAKSNALIDYLGPSGEPEGMIEYLVPEKYVPNIDLETNQKDLLGALIYDVSENSAVVGNQNGFHLFVCIETK